MQPLGLNLGETGARLCHELASPITVIRSHLNRLLRRSSEFDHETLVRLESLQSVTKHMMEVVQATRDMTVYGDDEVLSVNTVAQSVCDFMQTLHKRIALQLVSLDDDLILPMPAGPLRQILVNLVSNAIHATSAVENPAIELRIEANAGWISFDLIDNGAGVPADLRSKIFAPRFTTKSDASGSGLGLSISSQFAQRWGGSLQCLECQEGAHFRLSLPLVLDSDSVSTILLVEDDDATREEMCSRLSSPELEVAQAIDQPSAFELLEQKTFDHVITDLKIPQGDGVAVIRRAIELGYSPDQLTVLTGYPVIYVEQSLQSAVLPRIFVLEKPFKQWQLELALGPLLQDS